MGVTFDMTTGAPVKHSGRQALTHVLTPDGNVIAYAPGEPISVDDIGWVEDAGYPVTDSLLSGDDLRSAIAKAAGKPSTKEVRGPKEAPKEPTEPATTEGDQTRDVGFNATDAAVKLAEENDIDLSTVEGSGDEGRITVPDVQKAIDAKNAEKGAEG